MYNEIGRWSNQVIQNVTSSVKLLFQGFQREGKAQQRREGQIASGNQNNQSFVREGAETEL